MTRSFNALVTHSCFNFVVFCLILVNTAILAIDDYPQSKEKAHTIKVFNDVFVGIFLAECILKVIGLGP